MSGSFYEQLGGVSGLFEQWSACERTVLACALARKVPWPGLRLLQRAVNAAVSLHGEDERLERDANDEELLSSLLTIPLDDDADEGGDRLKQLLALLPLLQTDNKRAKDLYVSATPALVQRYVDAPRRTTVTSDLCRQLLTYLLVHPALSVQDQRTLTQWLLYLESHISGTESPEHLRIDPYIASPSNSIWSGSNSFRKTIGKNVEFRAIIDSIEPKSFSKEPLDESFSNNGRDVDISVEKDKINFDATISQPKSQRSNSLTPPTTQFMHMSSSAENLSDEPFLQKPRSFSLSSEHSLRQIRPISIMYGTTGSETRLDDLKSNASYEYPGMSMVAQWLKNLRLHKYVWLFNNVSYEEMMSMDEEYLEKLASIGLHLGVQPITALNRGDSKNCTSELTFEFTADLPTISNLIGHLRRVGCEFERVTKGARHKLLLSIKKLSERKSILDSIEAELLASKSPSATVRTLEKLRGVLVSPMPPNSDLPVAIVRVLEIASKTQFLQNSFCPNSAPPPVRVPFPAMVTSDDLDKDIVDPMSLHCWLVEKSLHHESFNQPGLTEALKRMRYRLPPRQFFHHVSDIPFNKRTAKTTFRCRTSQPPSFVAKPVKTPWTPAAAPAMAPSRGKSHSYPPFPPQAMLPRPPPPPSVSSLSGEDYSSLDALCLQMTEQAIN